MEARSHGRVESCQHRGSIRTSCVSGRMRLVREAREQEPELSLNAAVMRIGPRVGVEPGHAAGLVQAGRDRRRPAPGDDDDGRGSGSRTLEREVRELKRANEILLGGVVVLRAGARPATAVVVAFIDDHRDRFGVEPICRVLTEHGVPIAPSTLLRREDPARRRRGPCATRCCWSRSAGCITTGRSAGASTGPGRSGTTCRREGRPVGACAPVERLMRADGLRGVRRGRRPFVTTRPDRPASRPPDLVKRDFTAARPNQLWVVDFTYVPTWSGMAFTAFVTDVFSRRIVGWRTAASMPTELPLDALEMALWTRARAGQAVDGAHPPLRRRARSTPSIRYTEPARRRRRGRLDRHRRRLLRQRPGRVGDRALQDRVRPPRRTLARRRRPRARHPELGPLVQRDPAPHQHRLRPPDRVRRRLLPSDQPPTAPAAGRTSPPLNPGRFTRLRLRRWRDA